MELYSPKQTQNRLTLARIGMVAAAFAGAAGLTVCILCCVFCTTANASSMGARAIVCSTAAGWLVMTLVSDLILPQLRARQHEKSVLEGERETVTGIIRVEPEVLSIPRSISIRKVVVECGREKRRLSVRADRAKTLAGFDGKRLRLQTVNSYIASFEEANEDN